MIGLKLRKRYLSALSIVAAVLVLLLFISVSTYRNLDRAERNAMDFLHRQGSDLIQVLAVALESDDRFIEDLVEKTASSDDIAYVYLTDSRGIIRHHFDPELSGDPAPVDLRFDIGKQENALIRTRAEGFRVYELSKAVSDDARIVIGLEMTAFDEARQAEETVDGERGTPYVQYGSGIPDTVITPGAQMRMVPHMAPYPAHPEPKKHEAYQEVLCMIGLAPNDPLDLRAEIVKNAKKPFLFVECVGGPEHPGAIYDNTIDYGKYRSYL
jgi:hypothetical protein